MPGPRDGAFVEVQRDEAEARERAAPDRPHLRCGGRGRAAVAHLDEVLDRGISFKFLRSISTGSRSSGSTLLRSYAPNLLYGGSRQHPFRPMSLEPCTAAVLQFRTSGVVSTSQHYRSFESEFL